MSAPIFYTLDVTFKSDKSDTSLRFDTRKGTKLEYIKIDARKIVKQPDVATVIVTGDDGEIYFSYTAPAPVTYANVQRECAYLGFTGTPITESQLPEVVKIVGDDMDRVINFVSDLAAGFEWDDIAAAYV